MGLCDELLGVRSAAQEGEVRETMKLRVLGQVRGWHGVRWGWSTAVTPAIALLIENTVHEPPVMLLAEDPIAATRGIARDEAIAGDGASVPPASLDAFPVTQ